MTTFKDITGQKFGKITALKYLGNKKWGCRCDCGVELINNSSDLRFRKSSQCISCSSKEKHRKRRELLYGKKFGNWTVLNHGESINSKWYWECQCQCGRVELVMAFNLKRGASKGCISCVGKKNTRLITALNMAYNTYKSNANKKGREWAIDKSVFEKMIKENCFYCGKSPDELPQTFYNWSKYYEPYTYNGLDRVENNEGYTMSNTVTCCSVCNRGKRDMSFSIFMEWINRIKSSEQSFKLKAV